MKNFRDQRQLQSYNDPRLEENCQVLQWFLSWEEKIKSKTLLKSTEIEKSLISYQTREDIMSLLTGFDEMCKIHFKSSAVSIIPSRTNNDVIENIFSQQRGIHNGANTNPSYLAYCHSINTIILVETPIYKKANAAETVAQIYKQ